NLAPLDRCVDFSSRQLVLPGDGRERHPAPEPLRFCQMAKFNRQRLVVGSRWRGKCLCGRADNYCEFTSGFTNLPEHFGGRSPQELLVKFGELTTDDYWS